MAGLSFGFLSTYAPTQCGLASFTASMARALTGVGARTGVVRLVDEPASQPDGQPGLPEVRGQWVRGDQLSATAAAATLNSYGAVTAVHEVSLRVGAGEQVGRLMPRAGVAELLRFLAGVYPRPKSVAGRAVSS
jgi:hypothetical protein